MTEPLMIAFWTAFAVSALVAKPLLATLLSLNSRQTVSAHLPEHQKKQGTPTMGGLMIVAGALAAMAFGGYRDSAAITVLVGFAVIGFVDDFIVPRKFVGKRGLGWKQKILMQVAVAVGAALLARISPTGAGLIVFLVLFYSNAYNFADGLDGLAGTILLGLAGGLLLLGVLAGAPPEWLVPLAALAAAAIPFLFLNAPPARVFMGDVGALPIGAVLGYAVARLGTWFVREGYGYEPGVLVRVSPLALMVISLLMVAELVPVPLQILSVKLRKKRIFPATPIHHSFEKMGWPETRVVFHFALVQALLAALALGISMSSSPRAVPVGRTVVLR